MLEVYESAVPVLNPSVSLSFNVS